MFDSQSPVSIANDPSFPIGSQTSADKTELWMLRPSTETRIPKHTFSPKTATELPGFIHEGVLLSPILRAGKEQFRFKRKIDQVILRFSMALV